MNKRIFIIAEAGVNHNGDIAIARQLVDAAAASGADAVKFQTFQADKIISRSAKKAEYQKQKTDPGESQLDMVRKLELSRDDHEKLIEYCSIKGIMFLSTPFDFDSIELLDTLGMQIFKIPSGEINNLPYLRRMGSLGKEIIMSTGMATLGEVETALQILVESGTRKDKLTILHCNTEYPTPFEDVNLSAMVTIREALKVKTGYSDHTPGLVIPIAAAALGARVIEKHFTLDKRMDGPDHNASLEPDELSEMVKSIRIIEQSMGDGIKQPSSSEYKNLEIARKSIVAACDIGEGETFTEDNITAKRPGSGMSPMLWDLVLGKMAKRTFKEDELISL